MKTKNCQACDGCGKVANDDDKTPWKHWEELPEQSKLFVNLGIIKPLPCDKCCGTGIAEIEFDEE